MAQQPGFAGWVTEVVSYTELLAHVFVQPASIVRYGALVQVSDPSTNNEFLAVVVDVSESLSIASIDPQALKSIANKLLSSQAQYQPIDKLLQNLVGTGFINNFGVREVKLRLLGKIDKQRAVLGLPDEPPRPTSLVKAPEPKLLQTLVSRGLGLRGLEIGELAYNPGVRVLLNPDMLTMHLAILGQTGAGKSETVKRLVAEYVWRKDFFARDGGVIVFDVAGEYTGYPYSRARASGGPIPLLDAVLEPQLFPRASKILREAKATTLWPARVPKTVYVPYDLFTLPQRGGTRTESGYAAAVGSLVADLSRRYGRRIDVKGLVYARHHIYLVDGAGITSIGRAQAANLISDPNVLLVVAAPLPDALPVSEVVALSASGSQYLEPIIVETADALGLLDVDFVVAVSPLILVLRMIKRIMVNKMTQDPQFVASKLKNAFAATIKNIVGGKATPKKAVEDLLQDASINIKPYTAYVHALLTLLALPELVSNPLADPYDHKVVSTALSNKIYVTGILWQNFVIDGIYQAAYNFVGGYDRSTRNSVVRGLSRLERLISPWLDAGLYQMLADRLLRGFSIVHLAEPSRGDVSAAVARLLDEIFSTSHRQYSIGRRTLIVVEEAHNLAPAGEDKASKRALLRIAREGRKWGLSLVLVSQRPGFIDENVLSQAATIIAMRITNPNDLSSLRRSIESVSQEMVDKLPDLEPGQAIISGPAVPERRIPLLARIEMLLPAQQARPTI